MAGVFLCMNLQCEATSRYIENTYQIVSKTGEHFGHDHVEVSDLQVTMLPYLGQFIENSIDAVVQMVKEMTEDIKKQNAALVDKLAYDLLLYIQSKAQVQVTNLVRAILENDLQYLRDNQDNFELLMNPDQIFQSQQKNCTELIDKVNQLKEQLAVHCLNYSNLLPLENERYVRQENERNLTHSQKQFDTKVNEITSIIDQQKHDISSLKEDKATTNYQLQDKSIEEKKYQQQLQKKQTEINVIQQYFSPINNQLDTNQKAEADRLAIKTEFNWCSTIKHNDIKLNGNTANVNGFFPFRYNPAIVLQPRLNLQQSQSIKLKMIMIQQDSMIRLHICDLRKIKKECPQFNNIYKSCALTLDSDGNIFESGQKNQTKGLKFGLNDIVQLRWNGPQMQLTTLKINTNERFVYNVKFDDDALIHFGVSFLKDEAQIQIV